MLKKIIAAMLSALTALCLALPAFAVKTADDEIVARSTTAASELITNEVEQYTFKLDGLNSNELYYEKLLSFVAEDENGEYTVVVWVEKGSPDSTVLWLMDEKGNVLQNEDWVKHSKTNLRDDDFSYKLTFKSSSLEIATPDKTYPVITLVSGVKFDKIKIYNHKVNKIDSPLSASETATETLTDGIQASATTSENKDNTESAVATTAANKDKNEKAASMGTLITAVVLVVVLLTVFAVCVLCRGNVAGIAKLFKKIPAKEKKQPEKAKKPRKEKKAGQSQPDNDRKAEPRARSRVVPEEVEIPASERVTRREDSVPVNDSPKPIAFETTAETTVYDKNSVFSDFDEGETEKAQAVRESSADIVNKIYEGELNEDDLTVEKAFVGVSNIYQLSINANEKVKFKVNDNKNTSAYVVVDSAEMYLNFKNYNKTNGCYKAYNSIEKIERCFDIYSGNSKIRANAQNIVKIVPAKVHVENREFILDEKGKIFVEG